MPAARRGSDGAATRRWPDRGSGGGLGGAHSRSGARRGGTPAPGRPPTCASGISPSGPVHLGNLRELMVPHLVADQARREAAECRHILSWDDYDRFRRVPAGYPEAFAEHIGRPLTTVPDPCGDHENWAEHFKAPLRAALARLGVRVTEISQTQMYTSGAYTDQIILAMRRRSDIRTVLTRYQTKRADDADDEAILVPPRPITRSGRTARSAGATTPPLPRSTTTPPRSATPAPAAPRIGPVPIADVGGKLVWKVDWPMRWAYEHVTFEPAGVDHSSPGSSFTVGGELVSEIFGGQMPLHFAYSFVGTSGSAKMSGSRGRCADAGRRPGDLRGPAAALAVRAAAPGAVDHAGLRRRGRPGLRRMGQADPPGRRRRSRSARGRRSGPVRPGPRRACCRSPRGRCRSAPWPRWPTSRPGTKSRSSASCAT